MTESTGFAAYALWNALKLHFTSSSYDYFKYNGKTNVSKDSFSIRKDKYSFYRLSRKYSLEELRNYMVANFVFGKSNWVGEMMGTEAEDTYKNWQKIQQSLTYTFENDIIKLLENEKIFEVHNGEYPFLLTSTMRYNTQLETLCILDDLMNFFPMWSKKITDDVVWPNFKMKCEKYKPFISYDKEKFKNILKEKIKEYA